MKKIFALVDCNNFYVSCERVFNPKLRGKPVVVLSNNDGCIVSRSNEAKVLGIGMGVPAFEIKDIMQKNGVEAFSSNYTLYADMSSRVMETLSAFTPEIEIYSIDEAFLNLTGIYGSLTKYGRKIRQTVRQWTGLPVAVGIGQTKTLAKIAARIAKKSAKASGVFDISCCACPDKVLSKIAVEKVWTVGIKTAIKLRKAGIKTAFALRDADTNWIRQRFGVVGLRTVYELRGICCYPLEHNPPTRKSVSVSRMFGKDVESVEQLKQAISTYTSRAGEKLREDSLAAKLMAVYVTTSRFIKNRYFNQCTVELDIATSDTAELIKNACDCIDRLYRKGYAYKKCGIVFSNLVSENCIQMDLFDRTDRFKSRRLMQAVDAVNVRFDKSLRWAAEGLSQPWMVKFNRRSNRYTTCWNELPVLLES